MTFNPSNTLSPFLQTSVFFPDQFDEFRVKFLELYRNIASNVNLREIATYDLTETVTGEQWFTAGNPQVKRNTFREVYNVGAIAAGVTVNIPHGLTNVTAFTHIYGTAVTAFPDNRPIPYASVTAVNQQVEINIDAVNINISNGAAAPNITSAIVVCEFLKN
jgi:hypothetical protein